MTDFERLSSDALDTVIRTLDASGLDCDIEQKGDGVLEITLEDDSRIIVNRHSSAQELWIAARSGGHHFRHTPGNIWIDTRTGEEFFAALARCLSEQSGESVILDPTGSY